MQENGAHVSETSQHDEEDLSIVADSYRVMHDPDAWDDLVHAWDRKLSKAGYSTNTLSGEAALQTHYGVLRRLLGKINAPDPADPITRAVHGVREPAMVVTRNMRVVAVNEAGRTAFGAAPGKTVSLAWLNPGHVADFREALSEIDRSYRPNSHYRIVAIQGDENSKGFAEVYPIGADELKQPVLAVRGLTSEWNTEVASVLAEAFGLTDAECEVTRLFFLHVDLDRIARARNVNVKTIRAQISHIFAKTDTRTQAELARLLAHVTARINARMPPPALRWTDPYRRERTLLRADNRRLAHTWIGDENGAPALLLPGIVNGYLFPESFEACLKQNGVKLHVLTRPGAGNSDRDTDTEALDDYIQSVRHFCSAMNLSGIPAIGIHSINVALIHIAASRDCPFSEVLAVGRFLSVAGHYYRKVPAIPRALLWLTTNKPWAADIVGRQGWRSLAANGVDWYIDRAYGDMAFDYEFTRSPDISAMMRDACAYTFMQSHVPFFDDFVVRQIDVRPLLKRLEVNLHWLIGAVEVYAPDKRPGTFYDEADLDQLERENERLSIRRVPQAAELIAYQQPEIVAQAIVEAAHRASR